MSIAIIALFASRMGIRSAYDDAVLAYLYVVPDSSRFDDGVCANVNIIAYLHRVVIEVPSVCLVGWAVSTPVHQETRDIHVRNDDADDEGHGSKGERNKDVRGILQR